MARLRPGIRLGVTSCHIALESRCRRVEGGVLGVGVDRLGERRRSVTQPCRDHGDGDVVEVPQVCRVIAGVTLQPGGRSRIRSRRA